MEPRNGYEDWEITCMISEAMGYPMHYDHPSEIMDEIARLTPTFAGVSFERIEELGSIQWPCNEKAPEGTPVMHINGFVRGKGKFVVTEYVATDERTGPRYPLLLTTGRILSQYNVGAQTRRTETSSGITRIGSKFIRMMPNSAAYATAIGSSSRAARARRRCAH